MLNAFGKPDLTALEAEHLVAVGHPELEPMMTPDDVAGVLSISRAVLLWHVRTGKFPEPDVIIGGGPKAIRRWFPATVWAIVKTRSSEATPC